MNNTSKIILITIIVTVLLLGLGYAAIQNITLNITGTAVAETKQENFNVRFFGTPVVSDGAMVIASIINNQEATMNVSGLTEKGQKITATYEIKNESGDLSADLKIATTNSNKEYFIISSKLAKTSLVAGEDTNVVVTVELIKTPINESVSTNIGVNMTAMPVQPGEEGTSVDINDYSQTPETLSMVTKENYGDYIDLGENIINDVVTTDDWRILYKDEESLYVILDDFLPASQVPESVGLIRDPASNPYNIWSETSEEHLIEELLKTSSWSVFTNDIKGASATGAPTTKLILDSYNEKHGTEILLTDIPILNDDLYAPHPDYSEGCYGYWLVSFDNTNPASWAIRCDSKLASNPYVLHDYAVRPVVEIPIYTQCSYNNGVWTVIK